MALLGEGSGGNMEEAPLGYLEVQYLIPYEVLDGGSEPPVSHLHKPQLRPQDTSGATSGGTSRFCCS